MGTTPTALIPYVEPGDLLASFPTQDKAKADRLEVLLADTGWINLTPTSGTGVFRYRCVARVVWLAGNLAGLTSQAAGTNLVLLASGVLPAAYRPVPSGAFGPSNMGAQTIGLIAVGTDGTISQWNSSTVAVTNARFFFSWVQG